MVRGAFVTRLLRTFGKNKMTQYGKNDENILPEIATY